MFPIPTGSAGSSGIAGAGGSVGAGGIGGGVGGTVGAGGIGGGSGGSSLGGFHEPDLVGQSNGGGCGCRLGEDAAGGLPSLLFTGALGLFFASRRRRRR